VRSTHRARIAGIDVAMPDDDPRVEAVVQPDSDTLCGG
jgi:hypothetical protein